MYQQSALVSEDEIIEEWDSHYTGDKAYSTENLKIETVKLEKTREQWKAFRYRGTLFFDKKEAQRNLNQINKGVFNCMC